MTLVLNLYRNKNQGSDKYGRIYARVKNATPIEIPELAKHMSQHNTPYSPGVIRGILTDMVGCIKELMLLGQPVKIGDLGIFSAEVTSDSAASPDKFDIGKHIKQVRLLCKATGEIRQKELTGEASLMFSDLANKIRSGEAKLSPNKGEYLVPVE